MQAGCMGLQAGCTGSQVRCMGLQAPPDGLAGRGVMVIADLPLTLTLTLTLALALALALPLPLTLPLTATARTLASWSSFSLAVARIFSSMGVAVTRRSTRTSCFCPMRCARAIACRSICGFQSESKRITWSGLGLGVGGWGLGVGVGVAVGVGVRG